ncbi:MAG: WD40 repeat domain-containing protein, partial [Sphingobacteriales bacterium]
MLAADRLKQEIFAWNFETQKLTLLRTKSLTPSLGKSENGDKFYIKDRSVAIYNLTLEEQFNNTKDYQFLGSDAMLGNMDYVVSSGIGKDNYVRITGKDSFWQAKSPIGHYGFSVKGGRILFWNAKEIFVEDFVSQRLFQHKNYQAPMQQALPQKLAYSPIDSVLIFTNSTAQAVELKHSTPVTAVANGPQLITADAAGNIYYWTQEGTLLRKQALLGDAITYLSVNGNVLMVGSAGRAILQGLTDQSQNTVRGFQGNLISSYVDVRQQIIFTGTSAGEVLAWNAKNYSLIHKFTSNVIPVSLSLDQNNNILVSDGAANEVIPASSILKDYFSPPQQIIFNASHLTAIERVQFSADGKQLLSNDNGGTAKLWDINNLVTLKSYYFDEHAKNAAFSQDGKTILMHNQNSIFQFNRFTGQLISTYNIPPFYN